MISLLFSLLFLLHIMSYYVLFYTVSGKYRVLYGYPVFGLVFVLLYVNFVSDSIPLVVFLCSLLCSFLSIDAPVFQKLYHFFLILLIEECLSGMLSWAFYLFVSTDNSVQMRVVRYGILLFLYGAAAICIRVANRRFLHKKTRHFTSKGTHSYYFIVLFMALLLLISAASLKRVLSEELSPGAHGLLVVSVFFSYIGIGVIAVFFAILTSSNTQLKTLLQHEELTGRMVRRYYDALLQQESDTRHFRHDMNNHLLVLGQLLSSGDTDGAQQYLRTLQTELKEVTGAVRLTGNLMVDAISNYYASLLPKKDRLQFSGFLPEKLALDPYHFNTIYANLLQNAIEAVLALDPSVSPHIYVSFSVKSHFLSFSIENSFSSTAQKHYC